MHNIELGISLFTILLEALNPYRVERQSTFRYTTRLYITDSWRTAMEDGVSILIDNKSSTTSKPS